MIGKQISGKAFGGCIRYLLNRDEAVILDAEGIRIQNINSIIRDFNIQRSLNPNLGKAVGHLILSWSSHDLNSLSPAIMAERAREYLKLMGIENTQCITVFHADRAHPHLHIVYNRVDYNGRTISDSNNFKKNVRACKAITLKYGYHMGEGKRDVSRDRLKGKEKVRYELYDAINKAVGVAKSWQEMETKLKSQGIEIQFKYKSGTNDVQGISFCKGDMKMKGSAIDKYCSYAKLNTIIEYNKRELQSGQGQFSYLFKDAVESDPRISKEDNEPVFQPEFETADQSMLLDFLEEMSHVAGGSVI